MSRRRKQQPPRAEWEPLRRATIAPPTDAQRAAIAAELGPDAVDPLFAEDREVWRNAKYIVFVERDGDVVAALSIRRADRKPTRDWRDFQRIKNEIAGDDVEAVELYPAMSRLVDSANHFWLWCLPPGERMPVGFSEREVASDASTMPGARQRPVPEEWL